MAIVTLFLLVVFSTLNFVVVISVPLIYLFTSIRRLYKLIQKVTMKSNRSTILSSYLWVGMGSLFPTGFISFMDLVRYAVWTVFFFHVYLCILSKLTFFLIKLLGNLSWSN